MKKIVLFCTGGMSTGILVNKIRQCVLERGLEIEIDAYGISEIDKYGPEADVILISPQVSFAEEEVRNKFPEKPVELIDMETYSMMKGEAVLNKCLEILGEDA